MLLKSLSTVTELPSSIANAQVGRNPDIFLTELIRSLHLEQIVWSCVAVGSDDGGMKL